MTPGRSAGRIAGKLGLAAATLLLLDFGGAQVLKTRSRVETPVTKIHGVPYEYGLLPNLDVASAVWGHRNYRLRTNSLGFRDRVRRDVPLQTKQHRIVFVGDSFTMGIGCNYEDTFVGIVDRELGAAGIEVLNASVDGYSTKHYARKIIYFIETVGLGFDELICCIDLSDVAEDLARMSADSPITTTGQRKAPEPEPQPGIRVPHLPHMTSLRYWLRRNSLFVECLYRIKVRLAPDLAVDQRAVLWTTEKDLYDEFGKQGIALQMKNIDALQALLEWRGIKLTVVVYPWIDQIIREDLDSRQVKIWREWCAANGARFINCFPAFIGRDADPMDTVLGCFIRGDNHFNEAGHKIMAQTILANRN